MGRFRTFPAEHDRGEAMLPDEPQYEFFPAQPPKGDYANPVRSEGPPFMKVATVPYKYREDEILLEIAKYIDTTYSGHYVGEDNVQSLDLILATGHATGFNIGNILKYGSRYGKKRGYNRDDLLKVIHYAIFEMFNHSKIHTEK